MAPCRRGSYLSHGTFRSIVEAAIHRFLEDLSCGATYFCQAHSKEVPSWGGRKLEDVGGALYVIW